MWERVAVHALQMLDTIDVGARLGEADSLSRLEPPVDVPLPGVVRGERGPLVPVPVLEMAEVPGAVADVDLRVEQIGGRELRAARPHGDPVRGHRRELHQPDRARLRLRTGVELRLLVDHRREQGRIDAVLTRMHAHVLGVAQRIAQPLEPRRARCDDVHGDGCHDQEGEQEAGTKADHDERSCITDPTNASSSSSEPVFS